VVGDVFVGEGFGIGLFFGTALGGPGAFFGVVVVAAAKVSNSSSESSWRPQ
jgi:hypothetical protein